MTSYLSDFKVGLREFAKRPGDTLLAAMAYAVGLGLVGLILALLFGVVRAHPKGIDFDEIQAVFWDDSTSHLWQAGSQNRFIRYADFSDLAASQDVLQSFAASRDATFNVLLDRHAERVVGQIVTAGFFDVFQVRPARGRFFQPGEDAPKAERSVVVSHAFWTRELQETDRAVGSSLVIDGRPTTIVGVAPPGFDLPSRVEIWMIETTDPVELGRGEGPIYGTWARLKPGYSPTAAEAGLNPIAQRLAEAHPQTNTGYIALDLLPLSSIYMGDEFPVMVYLMLACACLVLLIACTNVANLTLSRATTRVKELAIRASLGGSRGRLVLQMITEGMAIAVLGGIGGWLIAMWTSQVVWSWATNSEYSNIPAWMNMDVDAQVVGVLFLATLAASVVASIVPALQASRADVNELLKDQSRGSSGLRIGRFSKFLAFLQLAVSCGLLIATAALVATSQKTADFDLPYDPAQTLSARFDLPDDRYPDQTRNELLRQLKQRLETNPALQGVGFTSAIDMIQNWGSRWEVRGAERASQDDYISARHEIVSNNYFELMNIPLLEGRGFDTSDEGDNTAQVCVINNILAERIKPADRDSVLGMQIRDVWFETNEWVTVIGVIPDTNMAGPGLRSEGDRAGVYRPMSAAPQTGVTVFARALGDPLAQAAHIRNALAEVDSTIALYRVRTVEEAIEDANFGALFFRNMFGMFGIAALLLASIGTYGVMEFSVRQRVQEFGIRRSLGATEGAILGIVARMGLIQIAAGIVVGALLGYLLVGVIGQFSGGIVVNAASYLVPIGTVILISWIALYIPTRLANKAQLAQCLRDA